MRGCRWCGGALVLSVVMPPRVQEVVSAFRVVIEPGSWYHTSTHEGVLRVPSVAVMYEQPPPNEPGAFRHGKAVCPLCCGRLIELRLAMDRLCALWIDSEESQGVDWSGLTERLADVVRLWGEIREHGTRIGDGTSVARRLLQDEASSAWERTE